MSYRLALRLYGLRGRLLLKRGECRRGMSYINRAAALTLPFYEASFRAPCT